jgi:hypothetical protein
MPVQATSGAASYDAFGGGAAAVPQYIEDVFSTYLYTGTGGSGGNPVIVNGIDLAGKGGLVWFKDRTAVTNHALFDTVRGVGPALSSNTTTGNTTGFPLLSFNNNGFSLTNNTFNANTAGNQIASWTFREQPKFFDVVTYTGTGSSTTVAHNLGSAPGCIIVKQTAGTSAGLRSWYVYHRSLGATQTIFLNLTNAAQTDSPWGNTEPTSTQFTVNGDNNVSGGTYVAYLFAHNAGGFGLTGTDNVISCGSYATNSSFVGPNVNLGYEPAWVLVKNSSGNGAWHIIDNMRGWTADGNVTLLNPNTSSAESTTTQFKINATGFQDNGAFAGDATMIYIAIRRGPMKVPTDGTSVFAPISAIGSGGTVRTTNFPIDLQILLQKDRADYINTWAVDRLRGVSTTNTASGRYVFTNTTGAEATADAVTRNFGNTGYVDPGIFGSKSMLWWSFGRAPSFMDVVCYTASGSPATINHNLAAVPEMIIVKRRNATYGWAVYTATTGKFAALALETTNGSYGTFAWNDTLPTSSVFSIGSSGETNTSGGTYVAYLFASAPGVSKVGSYTGTGATQTINCGFPGGVRFVLIKRTDSTGNWWVWDTARGMTPGTDFRIPLNTTDADSNTNNVYTTTGGFQIVTADATINASGGTYIFLAIA